MFESIKKMVFDWFFTEEIKKMENRENELLDQLKEMVTEPLRGIDDSPSNTLQNTIDEFGIERVPGSKFTLSPFDDQKYVIDPNNHTLVPYSLVESLMKKTGFYKKYRLSEDFSESAISAEIMNDFMNFYGGSYANNNYFEWNFQKQRLMFERSQEECQKGVGKAIKDITTNFVLGDGIGFEYTDIKVDDPEVRDEIQSTLWKIWQENGFDLKQYTIADFSVERGEVFVKVHEDPTNKKFDVEVIDPWEVTDYVYDPNTRKVKCWFRDYYKNGQPVTREPMLVNDGMDSYTNVPYTVRHYKFNVPDTIVRGRSDIYCVLYWIKIYNDFLKCRSRLNRFRSSVAWHKTISGGPRAIASGSAKVQKPFPSGAVIVTDDKTEYKAIDAKIQAGDVKDDGDAFKIIIASSIQIPHHWLFGSGENTNLATAKNMSAVPKRKFMRRQKDLKSIFQDIFWQGLKFYLSGQSETESNPDLIKTSEGMTITQIKEALGNQKKDPKKGDLDDQFEYKGVMLKKKYLEITIPNIDEHNSEDFLRLVNAAATMRKNGIGSSHAIYDILGISYRKDQELLESEWRKGDFEIFRNIVRTFNQFDNAAAHGAEGEPNDPNAAPNANTPASNIPSIDGHALDKNADGVVDDKEEPGESLDVGSTITMSKSARGGA